MTDPDPAVEILLRHLANLHELMRQSDLRLRRIEACLGLLHETGRLEPLGSLPRGHALVWRRDDRGDEPDGA